MTDETQGRSLEASKTSGKTAGKTAGRGITTGRPRRTNPRVTREIIAVIGGTEKVTAGDGTRTMSGETSINRRVRLRVSVV